MKNRSFIRFLFGLFMLVALSLQFVEMFQQSPIEKQAIELSDLEDDSETEAEEDSDEKTVYRNSDCSLSNELINSLSNTNKALTHIPQVLIKIPSPPPELA